MLLGQRRGRLLGLLVTFSVIGAEAAFSQDLSGISVCIDPGHGAGNTNQGPTGLKELEINMTVALHLKAYLESVGVDTVILTRYDNNTNPSLSQREQIANNAGVTWFHSVHHNAEGGTARYTLLLYEEIAGHVPQWPGQADVMSRIMAQRIWQGLRTSDWRVYGDYTFYGTPSYLGVLNDLQMPGELSEATFHDHPVEEAKLRNSDFLKMEARALFMSFLDYFNAGTLATGPLIGIVTDADTKQPLKGATCTLTPGNLQYITDTWKNGLYVYDALTPGRYSVQVSAEGHEGALASADVKAYQFNFLDVPLVSTVPPRVVATTPDSSVKNFGVYGTIYIDFSRSMNPQSVQSAFHTDPPTAGYFNWRLADQRLLFDPNQPLKFDTVYRIEIGGTATDVYGHPLDGNGDGVGGDGFAWSFKTMPLDTSKPFVIGTYPSDRDTGVYVGEVLSAEFSKGLSPATVSSTTITLVTSSNQRVDARLEYLERRGRSTVTILPTTGLQPNLRYFVNLYRSLADRDGTPMDSNYQFSFWTEKQSTETTLLEDFEDPGPVFPWRISTDSTRGIDRDSSAFVGASPAFGGFLGGTRSGWLQYRFTEPDGVYHISYLGPTGLGEFARTDRLGVYVRGNGGRNAFRFVLNDNGAGFEATPLVIIDWLGWRFIQFDPTTRPVTPWQNGNGILEGPTFSVEGFELRRSGGEAGGEIFFDNFLRVRPTPTSVAARDASTDTPKAFELGQNYPNPFNPGTTISYSILGQGALRTTLRVYNLLGQVVRVLVNEPQKPGRYHVTWNGRDESGNSVPSGIYVYELRAGEFVAARKMVYLQ